ncbi:hypothetical protein HK100_010576, partial [Physocladia obscura]
MGPEPSRIIAKQISKTIHPESTANNTQTGYDPSILSPSSSVSASSSKTIQDAEIDKLQAKVWNPNSADSWETGMREYHSVENSKYPLPSDDIEQNRLQGLDFVLRARFQG